MSNNRAAGSAKEDCTIRNQEYARVPLGHGIGSRDATRKTYGNLKKKTYLVGGLEHVFPIYWEE